MDITNEIVSRLGIGKMKGEEFVPNLCPFCHGGKNGDKYTFAFNTVTGGFNCKRGTCDANGGLKEIAEHLQLVHNTPTYIREKPKTLKKYAKPPEENNAVSEKITHYFDRRGIPEEVLLENKVGDKQGNVVFNYYDEKNELVFVKYKIPRKPKKGERKSWRESGGKPILYGMQLCKAGEPLIIIEGEPDKLVLDTCGIKNGVSIPSGVDDFEWVELCWEWLQRFPEIIVWGDNDVAGKNWQQEVINRLDEWKLRVVQTDAKDANELLYNKGISAVIEAVAGARLVQKEFLVDLSNVKRKDYENQKSISTGFSTLDEMIGGFYFGELVIWTGYNGSGKSTLLSNVIINGMEDHKTFAYSGELTREDFKEWMDLQLLGVKHLSAFQCPIKRQSIPVPNPKYFKQLDDFYEGRMFLFDSEDYATDKEVLKAMEYMAKREGCRVFLIDNMLTTPLSGQGDQLERQARYIIKLKKFARRFRAVVHLVAHPRKPGMGQKRVDKYSVSGTANITDLADRVIGVHRLNREEQEEPEYAGWDALAIVFKDRRFGVFDEEVLLGFDYYSKRFYTNNDEKNRVYGWCSIEESLTPTAEKSPWE